MRLNFGKHYGKSAERILLRAPDYVRWMLMKHATTGDFADVQSELRELITRFDQKPITLRCAGEGCKNRATLCVVYSGAANPMWFCDGCDPSHFGACSGKLHTICTYIQACTYVEMYCRGRRADLRILVNELARAKGLPTRVTEAEAVAFFN